MSLLVETRDVGQTLTLVNGHCTGWKIVLTTQTMSCFLRLEGFPGLDCTGIKISACTAPQCVNLLHEPAVFYVAYNIYGAASSLASDNVGAIVQLLDPLSSSNPNLNAILLTLTGIFALVPGIGYVTGGVMSDGLIAFANVIEKALFAMPQIGRWLFPIDSVTSQVVQISALSTEMATIIQTVQNNLNRTLVLVMADSSGFLAFVSQGDFSESAPSLPDQTNYLLYAFNTYIIPQALKGNNGYGVYGQETDTHALATIGSGTPSDLSIADTVITNRASTIHGGTACATRRPLVLTTSAT
ncbi:hypothetical protein N7G274_008379 [Stereocaulon virgatum]|uniref:Uncharacterized protein n=1 Tax=Stereocaulon virgatum TaxID=373712 RepID=A0ABR3ZYU0_9LECA